MPSLLYSIKRKLRESRRLYLFLGSLLGLPRNATMALARLRGLDGNMVAFSAFDYRSYSDNPRYISEALRALRPETDIVWLFGDVERARKQYPIPDYVRALPAGSLRGICAMGRARVVVDNYNKKFYLRFPGAGQTYVQTWHGDRAFKKVGYDHPSTNLRMLEEHCSAFVTGSDYGDMQARSAFHYRGEILRVGYPRNDLLVRGDPAEREAVRRRLCGEEDVRLLLYAPTFRDAERNANAVSRVRLDLLHVLDALEANLGGRWKCLVRAHYMSLGLEMDKRSERLIPASDYPEMAELLLAADALLTDYSSCAGDFALTRRPIYLYQDDLEEYRSESRELYFDMKDSPYWVAAAPEELDALIERTTPERARENCEAILKFYGTTESGHAARSVAEYIAAQLDGGRAIEKESK